MGCAGRGYPTNSSLKRRARHTCGPRSLRARAGHDIDALAASLLTPIAAEVVAAPRLFRCATSLNLRTHGGIACMARCALIYRSLCDACTRLYKDPGRATDTEAEPLCDDTGHGKQFPNDNPV